MSTSTAHYNLTKPADDDFFNIADFNGNADKIDTALYNKVDKISGKALSSNDFTDAYKNEVDNLKTNFDSLANEGIAYPTINGITNYEDSSGVYHKKLGCVDLGSLDYTKIAVAQGTHFRAIVPLIKKEANSLNLLIAGYNTTTPANRTELSVSETTNGQIDIINSSYTDPTTFKNSLKGTLLFYELATEKTWKSHIADDTLNIKMLGYTIPSELGVRNGINGSNFIQRVGRVDLGTLSWGKDSGGSMYSQSISNTKITLNLFIAKSYKVETVAQMGDITSDDKSIAINATTLYINDSDYTNATAFKTAMQGVYLYYELANEITIPIENNEIAVRNRESIVELTKLVYDNGKNQIRLTTSKAHVAFAIKDNYTDLPEGNLSGVVTDSNSNLWSFTGSKIGNAGTFLFINPTTSMLVTLRVYNGQFYIGSINLNDNLLQE